MTSASGGGLDQGETDEVYNPCELYERCLLEGLTPRETEILRWIARGYRGSEIARSLRLSPKTIDNARSRLMEKLGIHDRVRLALFAIRRSLITAHDDPRCWCLPDARGAIASAPADD